MPAMLRKNLEVGDSQRPENKKKDILKINSFIMFFISHMIQDLHYILTF